MWSLVAVAATVLLTMMTMMSHLYPPHLPGGVNALAIVVSTFSTQRPTARNSYYYHRGVVVPTVSSNNHNNQYLPRQQQRRQQRQFSTTWLFQTNTDNNNDEKNEVSMPAAAAMDRTSFDEAGRSLLDEQDMKRMNEMGDFDVNPNVRRSSHFFYVSSCTICVLYLIHLTLCVCRVFFFSFLCRTLCLPCVRVRTVVGRSDGSDARGDSSSDGIHGH